jgi:Holliday junction DNA helicase RuvA
MISYLKGKIIYKDSNFIILETNGIGFQVFVSEEFLTKCKVGNEIEIFTHEYLREDSRELYGFSSASELEFFWQLLEVSGVGPKLAHKIISSNKLEKIKKAIAENDLAFLSNISGVGKKTAQKIILELKGKLIEGKVIPQDDEVIEALVRLGYKRHEAQEAVKKIEGKENMKGPEEKIKAALKILSK